MAGIGGGTGAFAAAAICWLAYTLLLVAGKKHKKIANNHKSKEKKRFHFLLFHRYTNK